jgi:surfactin synthase thioesterase subunit
VEFVTQEIADTELDQDSRELVLSLVRRDVELTRDYVLPADPGIDTPVHIWGADDDGSATPEKLDTWSAFLGTEVSRRQFAGGHGFVAEQGPAIAGLLGEILQARGVPC